MPWWWPHAKAPSVKNTGCVVCQLARGQAFYSLIWPGNGAQLRGGSSGPWAGSPLAGAARCLQLSSVILNKTQVESDAKPSLISFGKMFVKLGKEATCSQFSHYFWSLLGHLLGRNFTQYMYTLINWAPVPRGTCLLNARTCGHLVSVFGLLRQVAFFLNYVQSFSGTMHATCYSKMLLSVFGRFRLFP